MKGLIIGTAGHVDHGKTMLVKALTGLDTDRLKEEQERGISIELGFAFLNLPGGRKAGIIDVPGHERFIKNMLAGVGGMDMVMLVIAADEGVMPQTREHLDIIQLLQVRHGVVVLTKVDMVEQDWLSLVKEEVTAFLKDTIMEGALLAEVSSVTGSGIEDLKQLLALMTDKVESRSTGGPMRLPVDRVFSVTGFGTVVTGTLISGSAGVGDSVEIMPGSIVSRIRNVHVHGQKVERAVAGQRAAVNVAGLEVEQIPRGSVVAAVGYLKPTYRLDVRLHLLNTAKVLKNRARVRLYMGTAELFGRVILLQEDDLEPGKWTYAQLELEEKAVAFRGDRFVIRSYSPMRTIGGGSVIDTGPAKHKRFRKDVIKAIATKEKGTPEELVQQLLKSKAAMFTAGEVGAATGINEKEAVKTLRDLVSSGAVCHMEGEGTDYFSDGDLYKKWSEEVRAIIKDYHKEYPLRQGYPKEELRSRKFSGLNAKQFQSLVQRMDSTGVITAGAVTVSAPGFQWEPGTELKRKLDFVESNYRDLAMQPPPWNEMASRAGLDEKMAPEALHFFMKKGVLVKVTEDIFFHREALDDAKEKIANFFRNKGEITVGEARDLFGTSRKYALPLMEYFDREKITRRVGDIRVRGRELK